MIRKHTFNGQVYRVSDQSAIKTRDLGECDFTDKRIAIPLEGDTEDDLDTIIHEALHACMPFLTERVVHTVARSISRLLWRLKWRKEDA